MTLWQQYLKNKESTAGLYFPFEGSVDLGVSEAQLIASKDDTHYLGQNVKDIILKLSTLGLIESIVRNSAAVHEKSCIYENVTIAPTSGLALNVGGLDVRFFITKWKHAFAVTHQFRDKPSYAIEFFDEFGAAIQKVFLKDHSKLDAFNSIIAEFKTDDKPTFSKAQPISVTEPKALNDEQSKAFKERYLELKDVHYYGGLLETFNLDRQASYQYAPAGYTKKLDHSVWESVLNQVKDACMELMIFAGNQGIVQIQTGKVHNIERKMGYLNIFDGNEENFTLHLKDDAITEKWVVRRPTRDGFVTCIEGFDKNRQSVIQFFGRRQEGQQELDAWQKITNQLLA